MSTRPGEAGAIGLGAAGPECDFSPSTFLKLLELFIFLVSFGRSAFSLTDRAELG